MTDDPHTHDSIDEQTTDPSRSSAASETDTAGTGRPVRGLLKTAAGAVLGLAGIGTLAGGASASSHGDRLLVLGDGRGKHDYEITMQSGGTIQKHTHAGGNDSVTTTNGGNQKVEGRVWNWNADSYTYTGKIESVRGEGSISFHFLDGAFEDDLLLDVDGEDSGRHSYEIDTNSGDIDLDPNSTEGVDSDDRGASSEKDHTADTVSGVIKNHNRDEYWKNYDDPVRHILIPEGEVSVSR